MCWGRSAALLVVIALVAPAMARHPARAAARPRHAAAVLFLRRAVSGARRRGAEMGVGRGRPFVGGKANAFNFHPVRRDRGLFQLAVRACRDRVRAGLCGRRGLAAACACRMFALCGRDLLTPAGAAGASSERRGRRRAGRHRRRDGGALLVCGPQARLCDPCRRQHCAACGRRLGPPKRVARGRIRPIKAAARPADRAGSGRSEPNSNHERSICRRSQPSFASRRFPSSCPCATRPTISRR